MKPYPGKTEKRGYSYVLNEQQAEWLRQWFPVVENARIAKAMGVSESTMHRLARRYGLVKSEQGMQGIKRRQVKRIVRTCKKNGYYERIKGKHPSDATMEGTARMWEEIRQGKRPHPLQLLKRNSPRKYKKLMAWKSDDMRERIEAEKRRVKWGLPRKTRLTIAVTIPYTPSQRQRRYSAALRGYILAADCGEGSGNRFVIYFDNDTRRAPIFERNCIADGFRFEPWDK